MTSPSPAPWIRRRATRLATVQALYAMAVSDSSADVVLADFAQKRWHADRTAELPPPEDAYLRTLVEGIGMERDRLDAAIRGALVGGWVLERLELLLQAILRAGAYELAARPEVPTRVVISEYVEISHAFFSGREPGLVNAVLDRLAERLRPSAPGANLAGAPTPTGGDAGR